MKCPTQRLTPRRRWSCRSSLALCPPSFFSLLYVHSRTNALTIEERTGRWADVAWHSSYSVSLTSTSSTRALRELCSRSSIKRPVASTCYPRNRLCPVFDPTQPFRAGAICLLMIPVICMAFATQSSLICPPVYHQKRSILRSIV